MSDENLPGLTDVVSEHTDVTYGVLALIGASLLSNIGSVMTMGWTSPGSSLDYTHDSETNFTQNIVRDYIAWTSGRKSLAPGAEERLREFVAESGWQRHQLAQVAAAIVPASFGSEGTAS